MTRFWLTGNREIPLWRLHCARERESQRENFISTGRQSLVSHVNVRNTRKKHETEMGDGRADMAVELEADLQTETPRMFVIKGDKRGA